MFASKENKRDLEELSNLSNAIARGTRIIGTIETHGNLRIDGELEGDITTAQMVVEAGAAFNGASRMGATVKDIKFAAETAAGAKEKSA